MIKYKARVSQQELEREAGEEEEEEDSKEHLLHAS